MPKIVVIVGTKHGDEARDYFLNGIHQILNAGELTTWVADFNTAADIKDGARSLWDSCKDYPLLNN